VHDGTGFTCNTAIQYPSKGGGGGRGTDAGNALRRHQGGKDHPKSTVHGAHCKVHTQRRVRDSRRSRRRTPPSTTSVFRLAMPCFHRYRAGPAIRRRKKALQINDKKDGRGGRKDGEEGRTGARHEPAITSRDRRGSNAESLSSP
jgi:hypothetical protein